MNNRKDQISRDILLFRDFIGGSSDLYTFLHNTGDEENARRILGEGLAFEEHLLRTSDPVSGNDLVELKYFRIVRRYYGDYTIIIQISSHLVDDLNRRLERSRYHFSEALSQSRPSEEHEENLAYLLPPQFIRGYFDHTQGRGVENPFFDPRYVPPFLEENLQHFLHEDR